MNSEATSLPHVQISAPTSMAWRDQMRGDKPKVEYTKEPVPMHIISSDKQPFGAGFLGKVNIALLAALEVRRIEKHPELSAECSSGRGRQHS